MILLGFDPGGINSFGWATLHLDEAGKFISLKTGIASNTPDAISNAWQNAASAPAGVGIDAPVVLGGKGRQACRFTYTHARGCSWWSFRYSK